MGFAFADWKDRNSKRSDITSMVSHLTRPRNISSSMNESEINLGAVDNLIKILSDKVLLGSTRSSGFIIGNTSAVCFQDAPLYGIIQNVEHEIDKRKQGTSNKIRYTGNGLLFSKFYVYGKGGRPVIYDRSADAKQYLPKDQYWKIVNLELTTCPPKIIDWCHEREWRLPGDFQFAYDLTHVVLYDKESYDHFMKNCDEKIRNQLHGITILKSVLM